MRIARESRGAGGSRIGQARAVATSAGTLFVRSYERGERVYLAMASRGYAGTMPVRSGAGDGAGVGGVPAVAGARRPSWWPSPRGGCTR